MVIKVPAWLASWGVRLMTLNPRTILCVLQDAEMHDPVRQALERWHVVIAAHAFEALRYLHNSDMAFDAYVVGDWLPDLNGIVLCRMIRKVDPNGPICIFTSNANPVIRKRATRAGVNSIVEVQDGPRVLREEIQSLFQECDYACRHAIEAEERAIEEELARLSASAIDRTEAARAKAADAIARTARIKAQQAFFAAKGGFGAFAR